MDHFVVNNMKICNLFRRIKETFKKFVSFSFVKKEVCGIFKRCPNFPQNEFKSNLAIDLIAGFLVIASELSLILSLAA